MTIAILPARLANQIAAGEVVERPASVIKELIENSLDAGATAIHITVDKGGVKKIKITDNGGGIVKDELGLALSRHATSKIKDLSDLEAINSLGFRGEALASISSVARLTLTSKPKNQETAWQANAEGRDMAVAIKPAAHPDGTTIEVLDLFFNTPARRKFLRTEKTEFNHIDEVVRRVALARFDVSFTLTHNAKVIRQYRAAATHAQTAKRVAMVCGPKFIEHAIEVDCEHDNMKLSGWLAKPSFVRNQNDLCYSYVNGRMMRDKLINHAIRQAYENLLPADTYPAFVLFLQVDYSEVDVNVHPAKHEVRFHQSRYVHDFIYSVCHKALMSVNETDDIFSAEEANHEADQVAVMPSQERSYANTVSVYGNQQGSNASPSSPYQRPSYVAPLQQVNDVPQSYPKDRAYGNQNYVRESISAKAVDNYQTLLTPTGLDEAKLAQQNEIAPASDLIQTEHVVTSTSFFLDFISPGYGLFKQGRELRLLSLFKFAEQLNSHIVADRWQQEIAAQPEQKIGLVSQPLLLPVMLTLSEPQQAFVQRYQQELQHAGIVLLIKDNLKVQIRQFPALLRDKDVTISFTTIIDSLIAELNLQKQQALTESNIQQALANAMLAKEYQQEEADKLITSATHQFQLGLNAMLTLNSVPVDLTSHIKQLL